MCNKIKKYTLLLFLMLSINQTFSQCWFSDLKTILRSTEQIDDFRSFIKNDPRGFDRFKDLQESLSASPAILRDSNVLNIYGRANTQVKTSMLSLERPQILRFSVDFTEVSPYVFKRLNDTPQLVASWKILDDAEVDVSIRRSITEIERVHENYIDIVRYPGGYNAWKIANTGGGFIAKTGSELREYLSDLTSIPRGTNYEGSVFRSLTIDSQNEYGALAEKMTDYHIYSSWGRYDLDASENAMYLTKTLVGNRTEVLHYINDWEKWNTYEFQHVKIDNLLDLTDDAVRVQLGTHFDDLVRTIGNKGDVYEMTNVLASWARNRGFNGIIAPGARGSKDYHNIILFDQTYIDNLLRGITIEKILK